MRTARGRMATRNAYLHFGLKVPERAQANHAAVRGGTVSGGMNEFSWRTRVYWEDTDGGGVVYYANYLKFMERARTEWLRSLGHSQQRDRAEYGFVFAVAEAHVNYRKPARLDDDLLVSCVPVPEGRASIRFKQVITRDGTRDRGRRSARGVRRRQDVPPARLAGFHPATFLRR